MIPLPESQSRVEILDRVFRSRSHVRVLRALLTGDPSVNLTARAVGRAAGMSHPQVARVLKELERAGVVEMQRAEGYSLCELNEGHMLLPVIQAMFEEELHVLEKVHVVTRHEARLAGLLARVSVDPGIGCDWQVSLITREEIGWEREHWRAGLEDDLRRSSGLDLKVRFRTPESIASARTFRELDQLS